jgi:hypothetical protein
VFDSIGYSGQSGWFQLGGTSAAAPAWAGLVAIADQGLATGGKGPLSGTQAQTQLYALPSSDYHDITTGNNGYSATPGYDLVTGLGSPKANLVIAGLLSANGVSQTASAAQVVVATTTTSSSKGTHLDQTVSTTSGTGTVLGSPGSAGGTGASALLGSLAVSGQGGGSVGLQALGTQVGTVQAQPAVQHTVASTLVNQSPAPSLTSLPGQSLAEDSEPLSQRTTIDETTEPVGLIDDTAAVPTESKTPVEEEAPPPVQEDASAPLEREAPAPEPAPAMGLPSDLPPVILGDPKDDSTTDHFDLALAN